MTKRVRHRHDYRYQFTMHPFTTQAYSIYLCKKCGTRKDVLLNVERHRAKGREKGEGK